MNNAKLITKLATLIIFTFLPSCANILQDLASRERELKNRDTINGYLALEYLQYSRDLSNKHHWLESNYFAKKGIKASRNEEVFPEVPEDWDLDDTQIEHATLARQKLVQMLLNEKARHTMKPQLANLQLLYDCWISREKDPQQLADMARCKILFFRLNDEMIKYMAEKNQKKEIKIIPIKEPEFTRFDIYFDLDLYKFSTKADRVFEELFKHLETLNGDYKILLVGSADRMGKKLYNDILARKRSLAVKSRLIKNGIPEDLIATTSEGENDPAIITGDDDQNKSNRRVGVYVLKGKDNLSEIPLPLIDNYIYKQNVLKAKKQRGVD
jgi:outer membrane protein OmpA-like peptidoglycan-associated protein